MTPAQDTVSTAPTGFYPFTRSRLDLGPTAGGRVFLTFAPADQSTEFAPCERAGRADTGARVVPNKRAGSERRWSHVESIDTYVSSADLIERFMGDSPEELDRTIAELQGKLRQGDTGLATALASIAIFPPTGIQYDSESRALALETLAAARAEQFTVLVTHTVLQAMGIGDIALKTAAVAAVGDLPSSSRSLFRRYLELLAVSPSEPQVQSAARAALQS